MIYLVHRPLSGDVVGMSFAELNEFLKVPDHKGLDIRVETAFEVDEHQCLVENDWLRVHDEIGWHDVPLD